MYRKILIANRGEIACRIARTLRRMGIAAATVHSSADAGALHVREVGESVWVGEGPARQSYLDIDAVIGAARGVGADAVHPGFGFLSENAQFARRCEQAGLAFIGPTPDTLALFGDKAQAKQLAASLGIPTAGGLADPTDDVDALLRAVADLPRPFILKAVAGGGGKGMRVVPPGGDPRPAIEAAIREGRSSFGDGRLIAERYLAKPRHVEVQILGDGQGHVVHLFDRECSLQRRYQKVVEEAPVTSLPQPVREQVWAHAVALGCATRYLGLGTVEFAVTGDDAVFLEVNPRLQVEHPVTEAVLGLDLVQLQIDAVAQRVLPFSQDAVPGPRGVAVQARLYAEDAQRGFLPSTGRIEVFEAPPGVRTDSGVAAGSEITPHYDPMIAKLIAHGTSRADALAALRSALAATTALGVTTNRAFLVSLLGDDRVQRNDISTEFIDQWLAAKPASHDPVPLAAMAAQWLMTQRAGAHPGAQGAWADAGLSAWRTQRGAGAAPPALTHRISSSGGSWRLGFGRAGAALAVRLEDDVFEVGVAAGDAGGAVTVDGRALALQSVCRGPQVHARLGTQDLSVQVEPLHGVEGSSSAGGHGVVRAPMMGIVIAVSAAAGQRVSAGDRLATLESMKMEMAIAAPVDGVVAWVGCEAQGKVERHQDLFRIEAMA